MLVLTRRENESITIRDAAGNLVGRVIFCGTQEGKARLAFDFPRAFTIDRMEIDREKQVKKAAGGDQ